MKFRMSAEEFEKLEEPMKVLYTKVNEDYVMEIEGLPDDKTDDVTRLVKSLQSERDAHKETKHNLVDKLTALEELVKPKEIKEEVKIDSTDPNILALQKAMEKQEEQLNQILNQNESLKKEKSSAIITETITTLANGKVIPEAMEDLKMYIRAGEFTVTDDGAVISSDGNTAEDWLSETIESRKHWIPQNVSSEATGGKTTKPNKNDSARYNELMGKENLSPVEQIEAVDLIQKIKED